MFRTSLNACTPLPVYRFSRWVTMVNNTASGTGGAMIVGPTNFEDDGEPSSVEFRKPTKVRIEGNTKTGVRIG